MDKVISNKTGLYMQLMAVNVLYLDNTRNKNIVPMKTTTNAEL